MCHGTTTLMGCGHTLLHYTSYCGNATSNNPPRPCRTFSGPTNSLSDTCAHCHPPMLIAQITQRHESLHIHLMNKMREAGSREEVTEWQRRLEDAQRERRRELREANSIRWDGVVEWPGAGGVGRRSQVAEVDEHDPKLMEQVKGKQDKEVEKEEKMAKEDGESMETLRANGAKRGRFYRRS